jgi:hypothetical protein
MKWGTVRIWYAQKILSLHPVVVVGIRKLKGDI